MTRMLDIIDDWLRASGVGMERDPGDPTGMRGLRVYSRVDGATPSTTRQRVIESFNAERSRTFLMLVSTRAGGLGLNLATADTVIMYDPDFNPFVDEQAQSRAHRMGQRKEVVVYQLVTAATVEERIVELAKSKRAIERLVVKRGKDADEGANERGKEENGEGAMDASTTRTTTTTPALSKDGSVSRAAELAKVLMHGARKIVTRAAAGEEESARSLENLEKTPGNVHRPAKGECSFSLDDITKALAFDEIHRVVRDTARRDTRVANDDHVRVDEALHGLDLAREALLEGLVSQVFGVRSLERVEFLAVNVANLIDRSEAPRAESLDDLVLAGDDVASAPARVETPLLLARVETPLLPPRRDVASAPARPPAAHSSRGPQRAPWWVAAQARPRPGAGQACL